MPDDKWVYEDHSGVDYTGRPFSGKYVDVDFEAATLNNAALSGTFVDVSFVEAKLHGASYAGGKFTNVSFCHASGFVRDHFEQAERITNVTLPNGTKYSR